MNYKCNLCNKEFKQRKELVVHMQRKTPCGIKNNFDIVVQEVDKIKLRLDQLKSLEDDDEIEELEKKIVKQIKQLDKMYDNLNNMDQIKLKDMMDEEIKPLLEEQMIKIVK